MLELQSHEDVWTCAKVSRRYLKRIDGGIDVAIGIVLFSRRRSIRSSRVVLEKASYVVIVAAVAGSSSSSSIVAEVAPSNGSSSSISRIVSTDGTITSSRSRSDYHHCDCYDLDYYYCCYCYYF